MNVLNFLKKGSLYMKNEEVSLIIDQSLHKIVSNFSNPDALSEYIAKNSSTTSHLNPTLSDGIPGFLFLFSEFPTYFNDEFIHSYMKKLNNFINNGYITSLSLWTGLSGVAFSIKLLVKSSNGNYSNFLNSLNNLILDNIDSYIIDFRKKLERKDITSLDFDSIFGLSGITRYLLELNEDQYCQIDDSIKEILKLLVDLSYMEINNKPISKERYNKNATEYLLKKTKHGYLDTGLAHGLCGPLSILSIALEHGYEVPYQKDAIKYLIASLKKIESFDENKLYNWDGKIERFQKINYRVPAMYGWCYGLPGIARSIWIGAKAINSDEYKLYALSLLKQLTSISIEKLKINSPHFCHGYSGVLIIYYLMYLDTKEKDFKNFYTKILHKILEFYEGDNYLSFFNYDYENNKNLNIGLLEGTSGIILSLNSVETLSNPQWSKTFLLS